MWSVVDADVVVARIVDPQIVVLVPWLLCRLHWSILDQRSVGGEPLFLRDALVCLLTSLFVHAVLLLDDLAVDLGCALV